MNMEAEKLCECPMLNKGSNILIHIKTGNRPFLVNTSDAAQTLCAGTVVAAFGRGKFKRHQPNEPEDSKKEIKYELSGADAEVLYNGNLTTVAELVEARRKSGPSPVIKVNYFELVDRPQEGKPGHFELKKTHDVRFVPQQKVEVEVKQGENGSDNVASQVNLASLLPPEAWNSCLPMTWIFFDFQSFIFAPSFEGFACLLPFNALTLHLLVNRRRWASKFCFLRPLLQDRFQREVVCIRACTGSSSSGPHTGR